MAGPLEIEFGTSKRPSRAVAHQRPNGSDDATVAALGKLSEALETVEHARGLLYGFHRMSGTADRLLGDAIAMLRAAGHPDLAEDIDRTLLGRDTIGAQWTFQIVEGFDADYWKVFRAVEAHARQQLGGFEPHVHEAEMKAAEQG